MLINIFLSPSEQVFAIFNKKSTFIRILVSYQKISANVFVWKNKHNILISII